MPRIHALPFLTVAAIGLVLAVLSAWLVVNEARAGVESALPPAVLSVNLTLALFSLLNGRRAARWT